MKDKPKPPPLNEEQRRLVEQYQHLPLWAVKQWPLIAKRIGADEAISIAQLAICLAARKYDPTRSKFVTYATRYIWGHLMRALGGSGSLIRVPDYLGFSVVVSSLSEPTCDGDGEFGDTLPAPDPSEPALHSDELALLRGAIDELPAKYRLLLRLWLEGRTMAEAGRMLGVGKSRAQQIVSASLRKLRALLQHGSMAEAVA